MTQRFYITPDGAARLRSELHELLQVTRPEVTNMVREAAALGDRSENAEYIYGKRRLREIDRRIHQITKRLDNLHVVDQAPAQRDRVHFGAWVELEDESGKPLHVRIVGADEFDAGEGWISIESPLAKALIGKSEGDNVTLALPAGETSYSVLRVSYEAPEVK